MGGRREGGSSSNSSSNATRRNATQQQEQATAPTTTATATTTTRTGTPGAEAVSGQAGRRAGRHKLAHAGGGGSGSEDVSAGRRDGVEQATGPGGAVRCWTGLLAEEGKVTRGSLGESRGHNGRRLAGEWACDWLEHSSPPAGVQTRRTAGFEKETAKRR